MRTLYHLWLDPFCRRTRIVLGEKGLAYETMIEKVWERREAFLMLNPMGAIPTLTEEDGRHYSGCDSICEYLDEAYASNVPLIGARTRERAETRRLVHWFDHKFNQEVSALLIGEKLMKRFINQGTPDSSALRAARENIRLHLDYITWLSERRKWLGGDSYSMADIAAAAHISCVDYVGDVPWVDYPAVRDWYMRIKSRPAFRPILADHIPGIPPPKHYADLDF